MRAPLALLLACALVVGAALGPSLVRAAPAGRRTASVAAVCRDSAAIPASMLAGGLSPGCALTGRTVVAGRVEVTVPPPGVTVAADGLGRDGETATLLVTNDAGTIIARSRAAAAAAGSGAAGSGMTASTRVPADCRSSQYVLEDGGHPWGGTIDWKLRNASVPRRLGASTVAARLKAAFATWVDDRNDCGLGGRPTRLHESYGGWTKVATGITVRNGDLRCGSFNHTNTVEMGTLPGDLLGWTCYWWGAGGAMIAFDTRLASGSDMVTSLPRACRNKWDLQSVATHEFGHAIGLGHVADAAQTMHGVAPSCSTAPRTLGRGDRLGLRTLYGLS